MSKITNLITAGQTTSHIVIAEDDYNKDTTGEYTGSVATGITEQTIASTSTGDEHVGASATADAGYTADAHAGYDVVVTDHSVHASAEAGSISRSISKR